MVFTDENFKVNEGLIQKSYRITDEAKACEIAVQKELIEAIKDLARAVRTKR